MTLLASWAAYDSRNLSSVYILSDSRISWPDGSRFDYARKVFSCLNYPDVFGYCGDVLFPSIVLNQLVNIADAGMLFKEGWNFEQKFEAFYRKIREVFAAYPSQMNMVTSDSLSIIHASREGEVSFFCKKIKWVKSTGEWTVETPELRGHSDKLFVIGSGSDEFLKRYLYYNVGADKVSRSVFHCFCDSLSNMPDETCGGAPQLVGLYRKNGGRSFGIIYNNKRYFHGLEADDLTEFNSIEWRNELFENCDGQTMTIKLNAKRQPNPLMR